MVLSNIKVCSYVTASCISGAPVHLEFAPRGPLAGDPVPLRRAPPAPRWPSALRGPGERDPVPLRRPPPLRAGPLPRAGLDPVPLRRPPPPRRPSASRPSPLRGPAPPGRPYCPCQKWERRRRPLSSPSILGGEEASLLSSRKREGRRASIFAGALCRNI